MGLNRPPVQYLEWFGHADGRLTVHRDQRRSSWYRLRLLATLADGHSSLIAVIVGASRAWAPSAATRFRPVRHHQRHGDLLVRPRRHLRPLVAPGNISPVGNESFIVFLHHLIGPSMVLGLVTTAIWSRFMRSSMLDVINQDYVRTARAKGVSERIVLVKHVLRNALLPMITIAGLEVPTLLSGALVTETVFTWPGMGRLFLDSIGYRDYPVVMGLLTFTAILVIIGNLLADMLYVVADPRIRLQ
jgi:peptide/nickel transport system permease protein